MSLMSYNLEGPEGYERRLQKDANGFDSSSDINYANKDVLGSVYCPTPQKRLIAATMHVDKVAISL